MKARDLPFCWHSAFRRACRIRARRRRRWSRPTRPIPSPTQKRSRTSSPQKFPNVKHEDFVNGPYSMNEDLKRQWQEKEEFPPYEFALDAGKEMFATPFKNGKTYADCFPNGGIGIRQNYPYFDEQGRQGRHARARAQPLPRGQWRGALFLRQGRDGLAHRVHGLHLARQADGHQDPDDPRALAAFENGKRYFYTRRGQMNFSCASCHVQSPGERIRAEILAPALGILNAMPIYRSEWSGMGTTSRRFVTCNSQTRAVPLEPQADEYRDVEYFLSYVANGLPISGPGARP